MHGVGIAVAAMLAAISAKALPLTHAEVAQLCGEAEGQAHCGRLVEAQQLKRLPGLAERQGNTLRVSLFPSGHATFTDADTATGGTSFALWDHYSSINATLLFTTTDDEVSFLLLHRATGKQTRLPSEPAVSPDRQRLATADFCETRCENRLVVWRVSSSGAVREVEWKPSEQWADATVTWTGPATLAIEYSAPGNPEARKIERRLSDNGWVSPAR
jgi:hypothetical protein